MQLFLNIISVLYLLTVLFAISVIFMENKTPRKAISWTLAIVLLPVLGMLLYLNFGRKFRKEKIFSRKGLSDFMWLGELTLFQINSINEDQFKVEDPIRKKLSIIKLLLYNNKALLTDRNELNILHSGSDTFESLINDLKEAKKHIHLEYYIFEADTIGTRIADILKQKAREGVEVRFIYDDVGSWHLTRKFINGLKKEGVQTGCFMPVRFPLFAHKVNYRNHRKIVVIDGKIGYVGGINVADKYIEGDPDLGYWRDTHLRIRGHAVQSLQAVFLTDWFFITGKSLDEPAYFAPSDVESMQLVQITTSGPDSEWASIMQAYFTAITTAEDHIYISTPYFVPNESILTALSTAALRGVDVKLLLPGRSDFKIMLWASISYMDRLLEAGVKLYRYDYGFNHGKLMMVDGIFASIGTANMDVRSFDKNFEVNALIYDKKATGELEERFFHDLERSTEISLERFNSRPYHIKLKEALARVVSPLL